MPCQEFNKNSQVVCTLFSFRTLEISRLVLSFLIFLSIFLGSSESKSFISSCILNSPLIINASSAMNSVSSLLIRPIFICDFFLSAMYPMPSVFCHCL